MSTGGSRWLGGGGEIHNRKDSRDATGCISAMNAGTVYFDEGERTYQVIAIREQGPGARGRYRCRRFQPGVNVSFIIGGVTIDDEESDEGGKVGERDTHPSKRCTEHGVRLSGIEMGNRIRDLVRGECSRFSFPLGFNRLGGLGFGYVVTSTTSRDIRTRGSLCV